MATVTLDTPFETFSIGESIYSYFESGTIPSLGILHLAPTWIQFMLPTIDLNQHPTFKNKIIELRQKIDCDRKIIFVDSKNAYKSWGCTLSFTSYVLALPLKDLKSNPDMFDFFVTREMIQLNKLPKGESILDNVAFIISEISALFIPKIRNHFTKSTANFGIDALLILTFKPLLKPLIKTFATLLFSSIDTFENDEAAARILGVEKSLLTLQKYKLKQQEHNKTWENGSIFSQIIAYFTLDQQGNDRFNILTPSIDQRIQNLQDHHDHLEIKQNLTKT